MELVGSTALTLGGSVSTVAELHVLGGPAIAVVVDPKGNIIVVTDKAKIISQSGNVALVEGSRDLRAFNEPGGVALDREGNMIVTDTNNHRVCVVTPHGVTSILAGGEMGHRDGKGMEVGFNCPAGVAVEPQGHVIVCDQNNHRICRISPQGVTSTLTGGVPGFRDGNLAEALFDRPRGVAVDHEGSLIIADCGNCRVRRISPQGIVSTVAGCGQNGLKDGQGAAAAFNFPIGVAIDQLGNILVVENHAVRMITRQGVVSTLAGSGEWGCKDGPCSVALFAEPWGVAVDLDGSLLVADHGNGSLRRVTRPGFAGVPTLIETAPPEGSVPLKPSRRTPRAAKKPKAAGKRPREMGSETTDDEF